MRNDEFCNGCTFCDPAATLGGASPPLTAVLQFKPATWKIGAFQTGTDDPAGLCFGLDKKRDCTAATGAALPFLTCAENPFPAPPPDGTWDLDAEYPTFLDGAFNGFDFPSAVAPACSTDPTLDNPDKHAENALAKQKRWIAFHGQVAGDQFACIAHPTTGQKIKALIANGHGPGKCGSVTIWSTAADPGPEDRVVVSMQTGTRNWSTESSAQQYFAQANVSPPINPGGGGCFQSFVIEVPWECADETCELPTTNGATWTKWPEGGCGDSQSGFFFFINLSAQASVPCDCRRCLVCSRLSCA